MRRILVTLESRATIGYSSNVMKAMESVPSLELQTLVTGMHLMPELGNTIDMLKELSIPLSVTVPWTPEEGQAGWAKSLGNGIAGFADAFTSLAPDIVLISGDRIESFGLCVAAAYAGIPVAHIQAGDKSGHIDDAARMAMAKLAHIHLAPGVDAVDRLKRLGEQEFRIHNVGAPQLDDMVNRNFRSDTLEIEGQKFDLSKPYVLILQHPVMTEREQVIKQIEDTIEGCLSSGLPIFWIFPNSDLGFKNILDVMNSKQESNMITNVPNVGRDDYLTLLANATCLVGNSSSGILEAPTLKVPVLNIGDRQRGRPQATNILNCPHDKHAIKDAIKRALGDQEFQAECQSAINPFGDGRSGPRIAKILSDIKIDKRLMDKETVY